MRPSLVGNRALSKRSVLEKYFQETFLNISFLYLVSSCVCCRHDPKCSKDSMNAVCAMSLPDLVSEATHVIFSLMNQTLLLTYVRRKINMG